MGQRPQIARDVHLGDDRGAEDGGDGFFFTVIPWSSFSVPCSSSRPKLCSSMIVGVTLCACRLIPRLGGGAPYIIRGATGTDVYCTQHGHLRSHETCDLSVPSSFEHGRSAARTQFHFPSSHLMFSGPPLLTDTAD